MAKYFAIKGNDIIGVVSETTNKGRKLSERELIAQLCRYYRAEEVWFIKPDDALYWAGYSGWDDQAILEFGLGFEDERICLEESGLNFPEIPGREFDRWSSGRQFKYSPVTWGDISDNPETHSVGGGEWTIEVPTPLGTKEFIGSNGTNGEPDDLWQEYEDWCKQPIK